MVPGSHILWLNAVFYTANNIAYSALTALVTKNSAEQVEMGSWRFMFAFATSLLIQSITLGAVTALAVVPQVGALLQPSTPSSVCLSTPSPFSVKELPEGELVDTTNKKEIEQDEKYNLVQAAKLLAGNKYYMMICVTYILATDLRCHDQHGHLLCNLHPWQPGICSVYSLGQSTFL